MYYLDMPLNICAVILLFPAVLAAHNLDECWRIDEFIRLHRHLLRCRCSQRSPVFFAASLLPLAAAVLCAAIIQHPVPIPRYIANIFIVALLLNALGHCILSLMQRSITPGTLSAMMLVMPYCVMAIVIMTRGLGYTLRTWIHITGIAVVTGPATIFLFLGLGHGLMRCKMLPQR